MTGSGSDRAISEEQEKLLEKVWSRPGSESDTEKTFFSFSPLQQSLLGGCVYLLDLLFIQNILLGNINYMQMISK